MNPDVSSEPTNPSVPVKPLSPEQTRELIDATHKSAEDGEEHVRKSRAAIAQSAEVLKRSRM